MRRVAPNVIGLCASVTSTGVSDRGTSWRQGTKLPKDSHQFIEEFLVVVADAEDVLLILFGQGALLRRAVSECVCRHGPSSVFTNWVTDTAKRLGLECTIRPRGRPKKQS